MKRTAKVSISGQLVGFLDEEDGKTSFAYTSDWLSRRDAQPVSLTLPLRAEPYTHNGLHPFFENLLPEGWLFDIASKSSRFPRMTPSACCWRHVETVWESSRLNRPIEKGQTVMRPHNDGLPHLP